MEPNVSNLIQAANELLNEAIITLRVKQYRDLVIIVDNLDRIVLRDLENGMTTHDRLFLNRGAQLHALNCHVVYTLPISMVFSPNATALAAIFSRRPGHDHPFGQKNLDYASQAPLHPGYTGFGPNDDHGRRPDVLPMVKVINVDGTDSLAGMNAMCDIVRRRLAGANVEEQEAFDSTDTLKYLCRMSGGHIRNLLILIRSSCTTAGKLPLTHAIVEQAIRSIRNDFERALNRPVFFEVLREIDRLKALPGSEHDQLLLYNLSVLEYLNGDVWYAVNPAVRELDKFNPPSNE